jgi:hypothetical protein
MSRARCGQEDGETNFPVPATDKALSIVVALVFLNIGLIIDYVVGQEAISQGFSKLSEYLRRMNRGNILWGAHYRYGDRVFVGSFL